MLTRWTPAIVAALSLLAPAPASAQCPVLDPDDVRHELIAALLPEYDAPDVPGASVLVGWNGEIVYCRGFGMANLEDSIPAYAETSYRVASITKPFTATAIMMLVEEGLIDYDDALTDIFPGFPEYGSQITLRQLLHNTSGLPDYYDITQRNRRPRSDAEVVELMATLNQPETEPGTTYHYSATSYAMVAAAVEEVSGLGYADFLQQRIFAPLGMTGSFTRRSDARPDQPIANRYQQEEQGFRLIRPSSLSYPLGASELYSTALDLWRFDQALYAEQLVSSEALEQAFVPDTLPAGWISGYGYGWTIGDYRGKRLIEHQGSGPGIRAGLTRFPDDGFTVIMLTNRSRGYPGDVAKRIADLYLFDAP